MKTNSTFNVRFWGVRGSHPTPGEATVQFGGNTPCVEVQVGRHTVILDAGTGLIPLGGALMQRANRADTGESPQPMEALLLLSHLHHDHTQGLPFFLPAHQPDSRLYIYGPRPGDASLEAALASGMTPPVFPLRLRELRAALHITALGDGQALHLAPTGGPPELFSTAFHTSDADAAVHIRVLRSYAHPGGVLAFRIEAGGTALVYATDTEGYDPVDRRLAAFAHGADLLIHDAQYTEAHYLGLGAGHRATQGWGHSTALMACNLARAAGVRRLALFHFDPSYSDAVVAGMEAEAQARFPGAFAAREGLEIELAAPLEALRSNSARVRPAEAWTG